MNRHSLRRLLVPAFCTAFAAVLGSACGDPPNAPPPNLAIEGSASLKLTTAPPGAGTAVIYDQPINVDGTPRVSHGLDYTEPCPEGGEIIMWAVAEAAPGYVFEHWEGKCRGGDETSVMFPKCDGHFDSYTCNAVFVPVPVDTPVTVAGVPQPTLSLNGNWTFNQDANQNSPAPAMAVDAQSEASVTVSYEGANGNQCDCNAEHLVIPLGKTLDCSKATLEFDYAAAGSFGYTSTASVSIRFCSNGKCDEGAFYGNNQFLGSEQTGHSNCAIPFGNSFPAAPQVVQGHNKIALGKLQDAVNGKCNGTFDTVDVHMQGYACFKGTDMGSATLSNLRVY